MKNIIYQKISQLAAEYSTTPQNVRLILKEIESCPRYRSRWITLTGGVLRVNSLVFEDYMHFRGAIKAGLLKSLPAYDPRKVLEERGLK